jgi:hypothetical protein
MLHALVAALMLAFGGHTVVPADFPTPASGYCPHLDGHIARVVEYNVGPPEPRCIAVSGGQYLRIVNHSTKTLHVRWKPFGLVAIKSGHAHTYARPVATYLGYGAHSIHIRELPTGAGEVCYRCGPVRVPPGQQEGVG